MITVAIDPGVDQCAVAWTSGHMLDGACFHSYRSEAFEGLDDAPDLVVIERPVIYPFSKKKPADMMALARAGYILAGSFGAPIKEYEPKEWKGNLPKPVTHDALWGVLRPRELAVFPPDTRDRIVAAKYAGARDHWRKDSKLYYGRGKGSEVHNLLDAAALLMVHLGRLKLV